MGKNDEAMTVNGTAVAAVNGATEPRPASVLDLMKKVLTPLASLRLTVVLFALAIVLVFCGTLAQVEYGLWTVINTYFRLDFRHGFQGFLQSVMVWIPFKLFAHIPGFGKLFPALSEVSGSFPFPNGWLVGGLLLVNLLAAHAVRFRISWKRSGILMLHAGLVILMLSELVTGVFQVESFMAIEEGQSSNFVEHDRNYELAIIDPSDSKVDSVVVIPGSLLRQGGLITHPDLPFDIEVLQYMVNSDLVPPKQAGRPNPATAGDGLHLVAVEAPQVSGASQKGMDFPSAYVRFKKKGAAESLGTYLVSLYFNRIQFKLQDRPQKVTLDDKTYDVFLRFKRTYKPYTLHLLDFRYDRYPGTNKAKNFSSLVRLVDPTRNEDREVLIYMNNPLRYAGETFYQQSFDEVTEEGTVLQVVRNPGWLMPYISCALVAVGMLIHFSLTLFGFLRRQVVPSVTVPTSRPIRPLNKPAGRSVPRMQPGTAPGGLTLHPVVVPGAIVLLAASFFLFRAYPPQDEKMAVQEFGKLGVMSRGRLQPFDTLARTSLMIISKRQTFRDEQGQEQPAVKWLLDVMSGKDKALKHKVFRIENDQVRDMLGLERREGYRYALEEFKDKLGKLEEKATEAKKRDVQSRNVFDVKLIELADQVSLYIWLLERDGPELLLLPPRSAGGEWRHYTEGLAEAHQRLAEARRTALERLGLANLSKEELLEKLHKDEALAKKFIAELERTRGQYDDPAFEGITAIWAAYKNDNAEGFNRAVAEYRQYQDHVLSDSRTALEQFFGFTKTDFEFFFNGLDLFNSCMWLYVFAFVLACISWLDWARPACRAAFWLLIATLVVHTLGLIARMYLMSRPLVFVTNLYSSALFIAWGGAVLGLALEGLYRNGIGAALAGVLGFLSMVIAYYLGLDGDTLEQLQAVLDTNFWLSTHVTCVTFGYAATFFAGLLGIVFILIGVLTRWMDNEVLKTLGGMLYGILCFATFFSFTGTVLGGLWADYSWGRFWGWDPKENGALLIVVWNALILHARWGGMIKQRGMAVLAVFGNIVTAWSWFGTNLLGVGLHAYGFTSGREFWLGLFWLSQLGFLGIGLLPLKWWRSFAGGRIQAL